MATLTPIDKNPFDEFYEATGADKPAPVGKTQLLGNLLFGALPGPSKLAALPLNENFRKGFMEGLEKSGKVGVQSMIEALENQYKPDNAVAVNDAGEWLDQSGKVIPSQRRPNLLPITKSQPGEGWFGSNVEGAMPAMADIWNTMGGVAGKGGVSLGAGPMLRPALKYQDKIYKAKEGQQHLDALPAHLQDTFQKMAMSGEDISHFNFGFINHKGHFLSREDALRYAIDNGILDPNDAKYGTLVTTMLNDSGGGQKLASQAVSQSRDWKVKGFEDADWFHGTTHEFNKFSKAKGNVENHLGEYPHFTSSPEDAGANYAGFGPDLTNRIEKRAEEFLDDNLKWGTPEYNKAFEEAKKKAAKELAGKHEGAIIPAKMKLDNPASLVDSKPTWIDFAPKYDKDGEWVKDNPNTIKLLNSLKKLGEKYNFNGQQVFDDIGEKLELFDSVRASDLNKALRESEPFIYDAMKGDKLASSHVISEVFKALGFDGIVMDAKSAFPNMKNIPEGTLHAVPLKRNTVKGKYSDQILYNQSGGEGKVASQAAASMRNKDLKIEKTFGVNNEPIYTVKNKNGDYVAEARMSHTGEYVVDLGVKPEFRRQGIATDLYNHIEKDLGKKLKPSPVYQTKEGDAFWKNRNKPAPTFYSAAEKAVEGIKQNKASGEQWLSTISNQKGVKGEELEWIGLKEFLAGKQSVTKQEIQDYLKNNKVELQEVWKGKDVKGEFMTPDNPNFDPDRIQRVSETKYHSYQLPGGENYRELLLTLPKKKIDPVEFGKQWYDNWVKRGGDVDWEKLPQAERDKWIKAADEQANGMGIHPDNYKSSHWDEPNILAHMRMNDRTIDGKKSLHLEEIQSDWHQQGRDKGYKDKNFKEDYDKYAQDLRERAKAHWYAEAEKLNLPKEKADQIRAKTLPDDLPIHQVAKYMDEEAKLNEMWNIRQSNINKIPDAPFKKTWHELALKRAIREAAENGYERLSWTPGEAQAARYDLSKQLKELQYLKNEDGTYEIAGITSKGDGFNHPEKLTAAKLPDVVGKEMAEKIIKNEGKRNRGQPSNGGYFDGVDLKIGGEGMKGFYDQIIPKSIEKIAKEFGVKVQKGYLSVNENQIQKLWKEFENTSPDEIASNKYKKQWGDLVKERRRLQPLIDDVQRTLKPDEYIKVQKEWDEVNNKMDEVHNQMVRDTLQRKEKELKGEPIYYIDIPENMRQSIVGKGQPLFSGNPVLVPIDYNPFEEKEK